MFLESSWSFDLTEYSSVWDITIQLCLVMGALLLGNTLRRIIPFLRKAFIPSALIGGLILLGVNLLSELVAGDFFTETLGRNSIISERLMQILTYHSLAIGFIAMSLKTVNKGKHRIGMKAIKNGMITGGTYMIQAVCGIIVSLVFFYLGFEKFYDAGIILPLGFGQGPGNALTWDINFTNNLSREGLDLGFNGQGSFGLTIASIGFIVASIVGVVYINFYKRKGDIAYKEAVEIKQEVSNYVHENEIEDSESVDKTTIQIAFVILSYFLAFLIMFFLAKLSDWTGVALFNSIAWGFNFIFGVITATLVKGLIQLLTKKNIIKKRYISNYQMDRISGFAFDMMIVAGVAAIDINIVAEYIWLIIALSVVGTVVTFVYVKLMVNACFKEIKHEAFLVNYGTLTGTASNGMILLREVDPNYETQTSNIFILSQFPAMLTVAPLLLLLTLSAKSLTSCFIALGIFFLLFIVYTVVLILASKGKILKDKEVPEDNENE